MWLLPAHLSRKLFSGQMSTIVSVFAERHRGNVHVMCSCVNGITNVFQLQRAPAVLAVHQAALRRNAKHNGKQTEDSWTWGQPLGPFCNDRRHYLTGRYILFSRTASTSLQSRCTPTPETRPGAWYTWHRRCLHVSHSLTVYSLTVMTVL